jgi:Lon protease-like protein
MTADAPPPAVERVALFPLNVVLFPGGLLPLRIFEPRYLRMVSECLREQTPFAVAAIVDGPEAGGVAETADSGTLARIIDWEQRDDGLLGLVCEGGQIFSLGRVTVEHDGLLRAEIVRRLPVEPQAMPDDLSWMTGMLNDLLRRVGPPFDRLVMPSPSADHVANRLVELLPLPLAEKQALFEIPDSLARLRRLTGLIDPRGDGSAA